MKKLNAQVIFAIFIVMLAAAVLTGVTMLVMVWLNLLPDVKNPVLVWSIVTMVVCILLGTSVSALLTRWYFKPIKALIHATRRIAKGDFTVRVEEAGVKNELVELMKSFNTMAEELGGIELFRRDFINSFSHEFKTPIVSIRGFARQLQKNDLTPELRREYTDIIISEADRLTNMASNILTLTKFENQQIITDVTDYRLDEQIRSCILLLEKHWIRKEVSFDLDLEETIFRSNEEMMAQVWLNLLSNAVKFSRDGGEVRVYCHSAGGQVRIEVEDHGLGMNEETRSHIFEQFYQGAGSRSTEGNGLGLTIVRRIIELARGEIDVQSEPNRGALFIVTLPQG